MKRETSVVSRSGNQVPMKRRPSTWFVWFLVGGFLILLAGVLGGVVVDSFASQWFATFWPTELTSDWYAAAWQQYNLGHVIRTTALVSFAVVALSLLIGVPAAYQLARRDFPGKRVVFGLFLLPALMPPLTYGIPLATFLYNVGLGRTLLAVVLVNVVPAVPFVILTMTPFIEQINPAVEDAARMCGARMRTVFLRILVPLLGPGLLAASVLVLVRSVGLFELTFLVSGPDTDTLIVALYRAMTASGGTTPRAMISAISVVYTLTIGLLVILALRVVNPTQLIARVRSGD